MSELDAEAARSYHEATKHSAESLRRDSHYLDFTNQPVPFKLYEDIAPIVLPREQLGIAAAALEAISLERAAEAGNARRRPDLGALARLLYYSAGITKRRRRGAGQLYFRAAANTGALYHIDLYLVCGELADLGAGVYHFGPHDFALRRLRTGDFRSVLVNASGHETALSKAPVILVSASTYWRNAWKYRARAYRHCYWDTGTLHANLLAAARAEKMAAAVVVGFADGPVERLLALDPLREGALTLVALGLSDHLAPAVARVEPLHLATLSPSRSEIDYPQIRQMHASSSLTSPLAAASLRQRLFDKRTPPVQGRTYPLPRPKTASDEVRSLGDVIVKRGSTRAFDRQASLSLAELGTVLDRASVRLPTDYAAPSAGGVIDLYLIVHAVEGVPTGAYYYRREEHALELLREGHFRDVACRLGLFQRLPGDAAANIYCLSDLGAVLSAWGDRGYRIAQLEGGIRGGLMYLAAYAQCFGATGLTFLDDEVTRFFEPHAAGKAVMFLVALGRSAQRR